MCGVEIKLIDCVNFNVNFCMYTYHLKSVSTCFNVNWYLCQDMSASACVHVTRTYASVKHAYFHSWLIHCFTDRSFRLIITFLLHTPVSLKLLLSGVSPTKMQQLQIVCFSSFYLKLLVGEDCITWTILAAPNNVSTNSSLRPTHPFRKLIFPSANAIAVWSASTMCHNVWWFQPPTACVTMVLRTLVGHYIGIPTSRVSICKLGHAFMLFPQLTQ